MTVASRQLEPPAGAQAVLPGWAASVTAVRHPPAGTGSGSLGRSEEQTTTRRVGVPSSSQATAVRVAAATAALGQVMWLMLDLDLMPLAAPQDARLALLGCWLGVVVLACGIARLRWLPMAAWVDCALLGAAVVVAAWSSYASATAAAVSLAMLLAAASGLLLPRRVAVLVIGTLAVAVSVPILRIVGIDPAVAGHAAPVYLTALGLALMQVRAVTLRAAQAADEEAAQLEATERERLAAQAVARQVRGYQRLLHETVLNTLVAAQRGGLTRTPSLRSMLQDSCREALRVLTGLGMPDPDHCAPSALDPAGSLAPASGFDEADGYDGLAGTLAHLAASGIDVSVRWQSLQGVPAPVRASLVSAAREALHNIARHAQARQVRVLSSVSAGGQVLIKVRDDGLGFDRFSHQRGFGLDDAVLAQVAEVGGSAWVDSAPGEGTKVYLTWSPDSRARQVDQAPGLAFMPAIAALGMYVAIAAAIAWMQYDSAPLTGPTILLCVVLGLLVLVAAVETPVAWPMVVVVAAVGPLLGMLAHTQWYADVSSWDAAAVAAMFAVVAAIGPPWAWLLLAAAWLTVAPSPWDQVVTPPLVVIMTGALVGAALRHSARRSESARATRMQAEAARRAEQQGLVRILNRYAHLSQSGAGRLLQLLADGAVDAEDSRVRQWAGCEERFIRTVMAVDPESGPVARFVLQVAAAARRSGVLLQVDADPAALACPTTPGAWAQVVAAVASVMPAGESAHLAVHVDADVLVVRLRAQVTPAQLPDLDLAGVQVLGGSPGPAREPVVWQACQKVVL